MQCYVPPASSQQPLMSSAVCAWLARLAFGALQCFALPYPVSKSFSSWALESSLLGSDFVFC